MNDKFYTPDISEFHVGFECENFNFIEGKFKPFVIDVFRLHEILDHELEDYFEPTHYRVKFLDQQDIEECGFELDKIVLQEFYKEKEVYVKPDVYGYMIWKVRCQHRPDTHWFRIEALFEDNEWSVLFEGKIKNKSQLKMILNMIEI